MIRVTDISRIKSTLQVEWEYTGKVRLTAQPLYCNPAPRDNEDTANFILSHSLPLLAAIGEEIRLPYPLSLYSASFWSQKIDTLRDFFNVPVELKVAPVVDLDVRAREGDRIALLFGGGADSAAVAIDLVEDHYEPILVHIKDYHSVDDYLFVPFMKQIAKILNLEWRVVDSNILTYDPFCMPINYLLNHDKLEAWSNQYGHWRYAQQISWGFKMVFAILGAIPEDTTTIIIAGCAEDPLEHHGFGFSYWNHIKYRGIEVISRCMGTKAQEYDLLFNRYPEIGKLVKPCQEASVHWCGLCSKCAEARLMQLANGRRDALKVNSFAYANLIHSPQYICKLGNALYHYRSKVPKIVRDPNVENELMAAVADNVRKTCYAESLAGRAS